MKKLILILLTGMLSTSGFSQFVQEGTSVLSVSAGKALAGGVTINDTTLDYSQDNGQVISAAYDFFMTDHFAIGFLIANQVVNVTVTDTLLGGTEFLLEEGKVNRLYVGFRGQWHYGNGEHVRFYSGFRLGLVNFSSYGVSQRFPGEESNIERDNNRSRYSLGITPIGMNIFVTDNFAAHIETNIGAPGFFFVGMNYRF